MRVGHRQAPIEKSRYRKITAFCYLNLKVVACCDNSIVVPPETMRFFSRRRSEVKCNSAGGKECVGVRALLCESRTPPSTYLGRSLPSMVARH